MPAGAPVQVAKSQPSGWMVIYGCSSAWKLSEARNAALSMSSATSRSVTVKERMAITGSCTSCLPSSPREEQRVAVRTLTSAVCCEQPQRSTHGGYTTAGSSALVGAIAVALTMVDAARGGRDHRFHSSI
jgi:hypothetical protein